MSKKTMQQTDGDAAAHPPVRHEAVVGLRRGFREARELAKFTQTEAAKRLGVEPEVLRAHENQLDHSTLRVDLIVKASRVYDVEIGFLFGISEAEEDRERERILFESVVTEDKETITELLRPHKLSADYEKIISGFEEKAEGIATAFNRFKELNQEFEEDMRGGANLQNSITQLSEFAEASRQKIVRLNALMKKHYGGQSQIEFK